MSYLRAFRRSLGTLMFVLMLSWQVGQPLQAATLYWDTDTNAANNNVGTGAGLGGAGNWNNSLSGTPLQNWFNGTSDTSWVNENNDTAVFRGAAGTVTLTDNVTVGGLMFNTTAYTINGTTNSKTLTFGAANNLITLNNIAAATITSGVSSVASSNVTLSGGIYGGQTAGTLTFNGTQNGTGWSGTTTINNGMTMALAASNLALAATTGITLNGGGITLTNTSSTEALLNRVANGAGITSNGGTITFTNTSGTAVYAETLGTVALTSGQLNLVETTNQAGAGSQTLTLSGLTRTGATNTSAITFSSASGLNTTKNMIVVTGATATTAGQIIGPWATVGTTAALQTDYAVYNASSQVVGAGIAGSLESTWTNASNAYTSSASQTLATTRTIAALLNTGATSTLTLAAGANLQTYGLLNGVATLLTVATGTGGVLTTPTGGGNLYVNTGSAGITISAPISDNGGAVTLVKTGSAGALTLSSTSNSYSGGTVIDAAARPAIGAATTAAISIGADTNLGALTGGLTFNSSGTLQITASLTLNAARTITINNGAIAKFTEAAFDLVIAGKVTGTGGIIIETTSGTHGVTLSNTANDFQGVLVIGFTSNSVTGVIASLADSASANGAIRLQATTGNGIFQWSTAAISALVLNNRQFDLMGTGGTATIDNSNASAANTITVNTDLMVSGAGAKTFTLQGANTGSNTFAGVIGDGTSAVISLTKAGTGTWILAGSNTYSGNTNVNTGILKIAGADGAINNSSIAINPGATLTVDNTTAAGGIKLNRLNSQNLTLTNGTFNYISGTGASTDAVGTLALNSGGNSIINLTANTTGATSVTVSSLTRAAGATLLLTGANLGAAAGANNTNLIVTANGAGADAIGGTGLAGSTSISINSFVLGQDTALSGSAQYGFMTDKINGSMLAGGLRNLTSAEYAGSIADAATFLDNVSLSSLVSGLDSAGTKINSLRLNSGGSVSGSGTLTLNSGAILSLAGNGYTGISVSNLAFGAQEAIIYTVTSDLRINSVISGSGGLTKSSNGVLTFNGVNNYTGATKVNGGVLRAGTTSAFGPNSAVSLATTAGVVLDLAGFDNSLGSLSGGSATAGIVSLRGATLTVGSDNTDTTFAGLIYSTGSLVKTGTGTLTLSAANTFAGSTTINSGGTLKGGIAAFLPAATALTVNGTLDLNAVAVTVGQFTGSGVVTNTNATAVALTLGNFAGNFDTTFSGVFNSTTPASLTLTKTGGGTLTLTSAAGTATGAWTLNAGTIKLDYSAGSVTGNIMNQVATLTLQGGSLNVTGRSGAAVTQTLNAFTLGVRGGQITLVDGGGGGSTLLNVTGALTTTAAGGAMLITAPTNTSVTFATAADATGLLGAGRIVFSDGTAGGFNWATNSGAGSVTTGLGSYTNLVASGSTSTINYLQTGTLVGGITASEAVNTLKITDVAAGGTLALAGNVLTITTGGLLYTGANGYLISSTTGSLKSGVATNSDLIIHQYGAGTLTISAIIADGTGASTLTKAGTGRLVLSGVNTYTGATFVDAGILSISNNNQLGNTLTSAINLTDGATLQTTATFSTGTHTYSLTGGNAMLDIAPATTLTINGVISGAGGLTLNNTGTLSITAAATYTGATYVNSGTLQGGVATFINASTGGNLNVGASGLVEMNNFTLTVGGIAGSGNIKNSGGTAAALTVGGNNQSTVYSGVLQATGTAANLNFIKNGTGTLTLNASNLYTGTTTVNNGTIQWGVDNALTSTTVVTLGNAAGPIVAMLDLNGHSQTLAGPTLYGTTSTATSQAIINIGAGGNLTLAGTLTATVNATAANGFLGAFINGGTLTMTAARTFAIADSINAAADLTITSAITGAAGGITKTGAGNLVLAGVNTTTGANIIQVGTLTAGVNGALSTAGTWTVTATGAGVTATLDLSGTVQSLNNVLALGGSTATSTPVVNLNGGTLSILNGITYSASGNPLGGQIIGGTLDLGSATRTITVGNSTNAAVDLAISSVISGAGGVTVAGVGQLLLSGQSTYAGNTTLSAAGIVQAGVNNALPFGDGKGNLIINAGTFDLNGFNINLNAVTAAAAGGTIDNTSSSSTTLTIGNNDTTGTFYAGVIANSGAGALNLTKTGTGAASFTGAVGIKGALTVNAGTLNLLGTLTTPGSMTGVTVAGGGTLNMISSSVAALSNLTTLNLGSGSGTATLGLTLGATASTLTTNNSATTANTVLINLSAISGIASGTYTLLSASSGLSGATYQISAVGGFATTAQSISDTAVSVTLGAATATTLYWKGGVDNSWNTLNGSFQSNWTDVTGTVNSQAMPGFANTAIFSANGQSGTSIATTLGMNVILNDLQFNSALGSGPVGSISIAAGANAANTLTIAPSSSSTGITVLTGAPASISISAPVNLGAAQTWTVADADTVLTVSGVISGAAGNSLSKAGAGTLILSSAGNLFGGAATTVNVQAGTLQFSADAQLGSSLNTLTIGTSTSVGTLQYTGSTATIARAIALGTQAGSATGDTISVGSGTILTLSGVISGGAASGVVGNNSLTITGGGTVVLSASNTFTGDVIVAGNSTLSVNTIVTTLNLGTAALNQKPKQVFIQSGSTYVATASQNPVAFTSANSVFYSFGQNSSSSTTVSVASGATFQFDDAGQFTLNGTLNLTGAGTLLLGGNYDVLTAAYGSSTLTTGVQSGSSINVGGTATLQLQANAAALGGTNKASITLNDGTTLDLRLNTGGIFGNDVTIAGDVTLKSGRTTAAATNITLTMGDLTVGGGTVTFANGNLNTAPGVANLTFTSTTLTSDVIFNLTNVNGSGIATLNLGGLDDGGTARTITTTGGGALGINAASTSFTGTINVTGGSYLVLGAAGANTGTVNVLNGSVVYTATGANAAGTVNVGDTSGSNAATLAIGANGVVVDNAFVIRDGSSGATNITTVSTATVAVPNLLGFGMPVGGMGTIAAPITLAKSSGAVNFGAAANTSLVITGAVGESGGAKTFNAVGPGTVYLLGDKNFTGGISITGGALILGAGPTSTNFSGTTTINGGLLGLLGSYALPGALVIGSSGGSLLYAPAAATTDYSSLLTLTSGGTLILDIASGLTINYTTAFGSSSTAGLSKVGAGTLNLTPTTDSETFTGATTVGAGTLALNFVSGGATSNLISSSSILQMQGGTLTVNGGTNTSAVTQAFASTSLQAGNSVVTLTKGSASSVGLTLGTISRSAGAAINFSLLPASTSINIAGNSNNAAGILGGWATYNTSATLTDWAINSGNLVAPYASYTTLTTSGGGTQTTTNFTMGASVTLTAAGGASVTANSLRMSATSTLALAGTNSLTLSSVTGGILYALSSGTGTISGTAALATGLGMVSTGTASGGELLVYVNAGGTLTISAGVGGIAGSTNGFGITKSGGGTLNLTNATTSNLNNYTGQTVINGGVLQALAPDRLGSTSGITLNGGTLFSGSTTLSGSITQAITLGLSGGTLSYNSTTGTGSGNGGWNNTTAIAFLGSGSRTLTLQGTDTDRIATLVAALGDGGGPTFLIVNGGTTTSGFQLSGANSYSGSTTIQGGYLILNNVSALPGMSSLTFSGTGFNLAELELTATYGTTFTRSLGTGPGQVQWLGNGGFSAGAGTATATSVTVNLGGAGDMVTWGAGGFVPSGSILGLNQNALNNPSLGSVNFQNGIDFGALTTRTIEVGNSSYGFNTASIAASNAGYDAQLSGNLISTVTGGFTKTGTGVLWLNGDNSGFLGTLNIANGTVLFSNAAALPATLTLSSTISLTAGAVGGVVLQGATNFNTLYSHINSSTNGELMLDTSSSESINFNAAGFTNARFGAFGNVAYTGLFTPGTSGTYLINGVSGNLVASAAGQNRLMLSRTNALTGASSTLNVGTGILLLGGANDIGGAVNIQSVPLVGTNSISGAAFVWIANDKALGTGTITLTNTITAANQAGYPGLGAAYGDHTLANNIVLNDAGGASGNNFFLGGDTASDGVPSAGRMTYSGTVTIQGPTTITNNLQFNQRTTGLMFTGQITSTGSSPNFYFNGGSSLIVFNNLSGTASNYTTSNIFLNSAATFLIGQASDLGDTATARGVSYNSNGAVFGILPTAGNVTTSSNITFVANGNSFAQVVDVPMATQTFTLTSGIVQTSARTGQLYTKTGLGTFDIGVGLNPNSGASTWGTAGITIAQGTLSANFTTSAVASNMIRLANSSATAAPLTLSGGTLLLTGKSSTANSQAFGALTVTQGASAITLNSNGGTLTTSFTSMATRAAGGTVALTLPTAGPASVAVTAGLVAQNSLLVDAAATKSAFMVTGTQGGAITGWAGVSGGTIVALSNYTLTTSSTLSGNATVDTGVNTTLVANAAADSLRFNLAESRTLNLGGNTLNVGGILVTAAVGGNGSTITGGSLSTASGAAANADLVVYQANTAGALTIGANIVDNGANAVALTKSGAGELVLTGSNTFSGSLFLNEGKVTFNSVSQMGAGGSAINLNGAVLHYTGSGDISNAGTLTNGSVNVARHTSIDVDSGATLTLSGTVTSTLLSPTYELLTKTGAGTLVLGGSSNNVLYVNVAQGTLILNKSGGNVNALGISSTIVLSNIGLTVEDGALAQLGGDTANGDQILNASSVQLNGSGMLDLAGHSETIDGLGGSSSSVITNSSASGAVLTVGNSSMTLGASTQFDGSLQDGTGTLGLTMIGGNIFTLTGINTYTGKTTIIGQQYLTSGIYFGGISISSELNLGNNPANFTADQWTLNGGRLVMTENVTLDAARNNVGITLATGGGIFEVASSKTFTIAAANIIAGTGRFTKEGAGTVVMLGGANTYTGKTVLNLGILSISAQGALGGNPASATADQLTFNGGQLVTTATLSLNDANRGVTIQGYGGTLTPALGTTLTLPNTLSGTGDLTLNGAGTVVLGGINTPWTGKTILLGGELQISTNLNLGSPPATAVADQLQISNNAIFHLTADMAFNANRGVTIGSGGATITTDAGKLVSVNGAVALNAGTLTKAGTGGLVLLGSNSAVSGTQVAVMAGVLRLASSGALSSNSNLNLSGGVVELASSDFTRALGAGNNQVQFTASSGFSAFGAARNVNLGGAAATVVWNSGSFVPTGSALVLSSTTSDNTVTFQNGIDTNGAVRTVQVDDGSADTDAVLSGAVSDSSSGGGILKTAAGTLSLTGSSTYSGTTQISGGRLLAGAANVFSSASAFTLDNTSGVSLDLNGNNQVIGSLAGGGTTGGNVSLGAGVLTTGGNNGTTVFDGVISGTSGGLTKTGSGSMSLTNAQTYTGATTVSGGALFVNSTLATSGITVGGGSTLGGSGSVSALTTVSSGGTILAGDVAGDGSLTMSGGLTFLGGGTINVGQIAETASNVLNVGALTVGSVAGSITINVIANSPSGYANSTPYTLLTYTGGSILGTAGFSGFTLGTIAGTNSRTSGLLSDTGSAITLTLTADNPKWTGFDVTSGLVSSRWAPIDAALLNWKLISAGTSTSYLEGDVVLFDDSAIGSTTVDISEGNVSPSSVTFNNSSLTYTLTGSNGIAGTANLNKFGTGTLIINNTNSFNGGVILNGGVIQLGSAGALGTTNGLLFGANVAAGTKLQLNSNSITLAGLNTNATPGSAVVENGGASAATLTLNLQTVGGPPSGDASSVFAGVLQDGSSGKLGLTLTGNGTLTLSGANSYTGLTTISGGTLLIGDGSTTGSIVGTGGITNNAALVFNRSNAYSYTGNITGSGTTLVTGGGALTLTGTLDSTGGTTIDAANTLNVGNGGAGGSISGDILNNGALTFNTTSTGLVVSGSITGSGTLENIAGFTILTGTNNFGSGSSTTITGGTLQIGNGGTTGSITGDILDNGVLAFNRSDSSTFAGNISGTGSVLINMSSPTAVKTLSGTNTYGGGVTVAQGVLALGSATAVPTGSAVLVGASGTSGILDLNGFNLTVSALATAGTASDQTITNNSATSNSVLTYSSATSSTFGGLISNGASRNISVVVTGGGTLVLASTNTFTGGVIVLNGTIMLGADGALGTGAISLGTTGSNGVLDLNGFSQTVSSLAEGAGAVAGSQIIGNSSTTGDGFLTINGTSTFGGLIQDALGSGTFKTGLTIASGTTTLTNANTYSGATQINSGATLQLGNGGTTGSLSNGSTITDNGTLSFNRSDNVTFGATVSGSGGLQQVGSGILELNGDNSYSGLTVMNNAAGTLKTSGTNSSSTGGTTLTAGTLLLNNSSANNGGLAGGTIIISGGTIDNVTGSALTLVQNNNMTLGGSFIFTGSNDLNFGSGAVNVGASALTITMGGTNRMLSLGALTNTANAVNTITVTAGAGSSLVIGSYALSNNAANRVDVLTGNVANIIINGAVTNGGTSTTSGLNYTGTGILTLNGANNYGGLTSQTTSGGTIIFNGSNSGAGGTTLTAGTIQLGGATNGGIASGTLTLTAGVLQAINAARTLSNAVTLTAVTVSGSQSLTINGNFTFVSGARTLTSSITGGNLLTLGGNVFLSDSATVAGAATIAGSGLTTLSGNIANFNGSGVAGALIITNTSTTTLSGANTYSGLTTMNAAAGFLVLSGSNSSAGATTLTTGTIQFNSSSALGGGSGLGSGTLTLTAGTLQALNAARSITSNVLMTAVTVSGSQSLTMNGSFTFVSGSRTLTSSITGGNLLTLGGNVFLSDVSGTAGTQTIAGSGNTTVSGNIADFNGSGLAGTLTITNTGITTLGGANTYTGTTTMNAAAGTLVFSGSNSSAGATTLTTGMLQFNSNSNGGLASGLLTFTAGTVQALNASRSIANAITLTAVTVSGTENLTFNGKLTGSTGASRTLTNNIGAGKTLTFTSVDINPETANARTLTIAGTGATAITGAIANGNGTTANNLTITNTNTTTISAASGVSTYTGTTTAGAGTLVIGATNTLPVANAFVLGTLATGGAAATLDISGFNQTVGNFSVSSDNVTANQLLTASGRTLTINGNVTIGSSNATLTTTNFTTSGSGTVTVNNTTANGFFTVGGYVGTTSGQGNLATADFSSLSSLSILLNASTGTFRVSNNSTANTANAYSVLTLATDNTITAKTFAVGDGGQYGGSVGQVNQLKLGSGTNAINADVFNIGTGTRDFGSVTFNSGSGTIIVRAADGVSRVAFNMGAIGGGTGVATATGVQNTFDVTGHNADLLFGAVAIGTQSTRGDTLTNVFSFDTGTLDMTSLTMSVKTGTPLAGVPLVSSTLNLGGGTVTIGSGILQMGQAATATNQAVATINVTGGTVSIGATAGTAITMASAATNTTATASLNLTGGTTTVNGNIVRALGAGTSSATVNLDGGTLDMTGSNIGSAAQNVTFVAAAGTLKNLGELNGGGTLTKTTGGTLVLAGTNTYTGKTVISAGKLSISSESNLGANPGAATADQLTLNGGTLLTTATLAIQNSNRGITVGASGGTIETAASTTATVSSVVTGEGTLTKEGAGTLLFTAVNTNTGSTEVNNGILGGTGVLGGDLNVHAGSTIAPGIAAEGQLTVGGNFTVSAGGTLLMQLGGATTNDASTVQAQMGSNGNLTGLVGSVPSAWSNYVVGTTLHDNIMVNGTAVPVIDGTLKIDSVFLYGYIPAYGDVFKLIDWTATGSMPVSTTFDYGGIVLGDGLSFNSDLFASNGIIVVVPEPSRLLFLMLGLFGLMVRRRRSVR